MTLSRHLLFTVLLAAGGVLAGARSAPAARSTPAPNVVGVYSGILNPDGTAIQQPCTITVVSEGGYNLQGNARIAGTASNVVPGADGPTKFRGTVHPDGFFGGQNIRKAFQFSFYVLPTHTPGTYEGGYYVARGQAVRWEGNLTLTKQ